ncbi:MAG: DHH family phosphoesterase [Bacteroidales bacterium]|nr:DHH family phosphoesterase [Bacteroidales bacterium]
MSHTSPDGDAAGSVLGLYHWLKANVYNGRNDVQLSLLLPHPCPHDARYLPGSELIISAEEDLEHCERALSEADLIIGVDFNAASRVKPMDKSLESSHAVKMLVDHHHNPDTAMFDPVISVPDLSATCELLYWLLVQIGGSESITFETARCLFHGINTDTGGFAFGNEDPSLYEAVAGLMRYPIGAAEVHNRIVNSYSVAKMHLLGYLLDNKLKIFEPEGFAYISVSEREWRQLGCIAEDLEGIVNYTLMMEQVMVGAMVKETEGKVRLSLRSKNTFDVNRFANQYFGGGGHQKAAGATSAYDFDETINLLENKMLEELRAFNSKNDREP